MSNFRPYYELHITLEGNPNVIKSKVEKNGWSFSAIDNDIVLGTGVKCYATKHMSTMSETDESIKKYIEWRATELRKEGLTVIRTKVELVIYDSRAEQ